MNLGRESGDRPRIASRTAIVGEKPIHLAALVRFPGEGQLGIRLRLLARHAVGKAPVDHGRKALGGGNPKPHRRAEIGDGAGRLAEPVIGEAPEIQGLGRVGR